MKKKGVTLITGVLSIGCLFCVYGLLKTENAQNAALEEAEANKPILELDKENPVSLRFKIGEQDVEFSYAEGVWEKSDDSTFPVKGDAVWKVLSDLSALSAVRTLENTADLSEYGFEEPQNTFVYTDGTGKTITWTIGANHAGTGDDYLLINDGEEKLYTISTTLRSSISTDLYDFASPEELPDLKEEEIQMLTVAEADETYRIYKENQTWYVENEKEEILPAEEDTVESELGSFSYALNYSDFVEHNCEEPASYGIDGSTAVTILYSETAASEEDTEISEVNKEEDLEENTENNEEKSSADLSELILYIGDVDEAGNYYVQKDGSREVHTMSADTLSVFLDKAAKDWEAEPETEAETANEAEIGTESFDETEA